MKTGRLGPNQTIGIGEKVRPLLNGFGAERVASGQSKKNGDGECTGSAAYGDERGVVAQRRRHLCVEQSVQTMAIFKETAILSKNQKQTSFNLFGELYV